MLFVSHSTYLIIELCDRAIWIDRGEIQMQGDAYQVSKAYEKSVLDGRGRENASRTQRLPAAGGSVSSLGVDSAPTYVLQNAAVAIESVNLHAADGEERYTFSSGDDIVIRVRWAGSTVKGQIAVGTRIDSARTQAVAGFTSDEDACYLCGGKPLVGRGTFDIRIKAPNLGQGQYFISLSIKEVDFTGGDGTLLFLADRVATFSVSRRKKFLHQYACELEFELMERPEP